MKLTCALLSLGLSLMTAAAAIHVAQLILASN